MRVRREIIEARAKALMGEIINGMDEPPSVEAGVEAALASSVFVLMLTAKEKAPASDVFDALCSGAVNAARHEGISREELIAAFTDAIERKYAVLDAMKEAAS